MKLITTFHHACDLQGSMGMEQAVIASKQDCLAMVLKIEIEA